MAELTDKIDKILERGIESESHGDKSARYRSVDDLIKARNFIKSKSRKNDLPFSVVSIIPDKGF